MLITEKLVWLVIGAAMRRSNEVISIQASSKRGVGKKIRRGLASSTKKGHALTSLEL